MLIVHLKRSVSIKCYLQVRERNQIRTQWSVRSNIWIADECIYNKLLNTWNKNSCRPTDIEYILRLCRQRCALLMPRCREKRTSSFWLDNSFRSWLAFLIPSPNVIFSILWKLVMRPFTMVSKLRIVMLPTDGRDVRPPCALRYRSDCCCCLINIYITFLAWTARLLTVLSSCILSYTIIHQISWLE